MDLLLECSKTDLLSTLLQVLKKLLEPKCNICPYNAKDAVDYEHHISSLQHLKVFILFICLLYFWFSCFICLPHSHMLIFFFQREEGWTGELENSESNELSRNDSSQGVATHPSTSGEGMLHAHNYAIPLELHN